MDYVTITRTNGTSTIVPYPNDFQMKKEKIIAAEYTTLTGQVLGDVVGWRYADFTLKWDTLTDAMLQFVLAACDDASFSFTFRDPADGDKTISLTALSRATVKTRYKDYGVTKWRDIAIPVRCNDVYTYSE